MEKKLNSKLKEPNKKTGRKEGNKVKDSKTNG